MNILKNIVIIKAFACLMLVINAQATMVPYQEDGYSMQAPEELGALVKKAAELVDFTSPYEVVVPKKAGVEINPWNKFIGYGVNPLTKNSLVIINSEWFNKIPEDQQLFLIGRDLVILKNGVTPTSFIIIQCIFVAISFLLLFLLIWLMGKTVLKNQKLWVRILAACIIVGLCEFFVLDLLQVKVRTYYGKVHDRAIHELTLEKMSSRDAAIKALDHLDSSIKNEIKNGETFFIPYENLFESYAQELKRLL